MYFVLAYNLAKIAKQCKQCTKQELISDFYQTRFWAQVGPWKPNIYFISKNFCLNYDLSDCTCSRTWTLNTVIFQLYSQQIIKKAKQNILKRVNAKVLISVSWLYKYTICEHVKLQSIIIIILIILRIQCTILVRNVLVLTVNFALGRAEGEAWVSRQGAPAMGRRGRQSGGASAGHRRRGRHSEHAGDWGQGGGGGECERPPDLRAPALGRSRRCRRFRTREPGGPASTRRRWRGGERQHWPSDVRAAALGRAVDWRAVGSSRVRGRRRDHCRGPTRHFGQKGVYVVYLYKTHKILG